jgi:hypothetical protein
MIPALVIAGRVRGRCGMSSPRLIVILPRFVLVNNLLVVVIQCRNLIYLGELVHS